MYRDGKYNLTLLNIHVLYYMVYLTGHHRLNIAIETDCW